MFTNDNIILGSQGLTNKYNFYTVDRQDTATGNFKRLNQAYFMMNISLDQQINQYIN